MKRGQFLVYRNCRTVVMLNNDRAQEWRDDPLLGQKIAEASNTKFCRRDKAGISNYGSVVECVHKKKKTLAILDGHNRMTILSDLPALRAYHPEKEGGEKDALQLLRNAARRLGYRLSRIPKPKKEVVCE